MTTVRLRSRKERITRKIRARIRKRAGVGGKAKHQKEWLNQYTGAPLLNRAPRTPGGRKPLSGNLPSRREQVPYQSRATAPRPWALREKNRARDKFARASRKRNHDR